MSLCAAAACDEGRTIVLLSDKGIDTGFAKGDLNVQKIHRLHSNWLLLGTGDNSGVILDLLDAVRSTLPDTAISATVLSTSLLQAFASIRTSHMQRVYLASRGWTLDEFRKKSA